jgi:hypothetical protein
MAISAWSSVTKLEDDQVEVMGGGFVDLSEEDLGGSPHALTQGSSMFFHSHERVCKAAKEERELEVEWRNAAVRQALIILSSRALGTQN